MLTKITTNSERILSKADIGLLMNEHLYKDCTPKDQDNRKKLYSVFKYIIYYLGFAEKDAETKGLKWTFQHDDYLAGKEGSLFDEGEYLKQRNLDYQIQFRKEPLKSSTMSFEVKITF